MEEAAVHTADGLAAEPMLLAVVTIAVALIVAAVLIAREMRSGKEKQLEFEARSSEAQLNLRRNWLRFSMRSTATNSVSSTVPRPMPR